MAESQERFLIFIRLSDAREGEGADSSSHRGKISGC